jgi:tetratricopeptide (TPR) repeat protein
MYRLSQRLGSRSFTTCNLHCQSTQSALSTPSNAASTLTVSHNVHASRLNLRSIYNNSTFATYTRFVVSRHPSAPYQTSYYHATARTASSYNSSQYTSNDIIEAEIVQERPFGRADKVIMQQAASDLSEKEVVLQTALKRIYSLDLSITPRNEVVKHLQTLSRAYEDLEYWSDALETEKRLLDYYRQDKDDHSTVAACLYRIGKLSMQEGNLHEARRYCQQSLDEYNRAYSNVYHADKGNVMISLAGIDYHHDRYDQALEKLHEAEPHFMRHEQSIHGNSDTKATYSSSSINNDSDSSTVDQPGHVNIIKCWQQIGLIYRTVEDYEEALKYYQKALDVVTRWFPTDERKQSIQLDVADMLQALDRPQEALAVYQQIQEEDRGNRSDSDEETPLDSVTCHAMGKIHAQLGNTSLAQELLEKAVKIKRALLGESHPEVGRSLSALGAVCAVQDNKSAALTHFQEALVIARMHSPEGENDPEVMLALRNIAVLRGEKVSRF